MLARELDPNQVKNLLDTTRIYVSSVHPISGDEKVNELENDG